MSPWNLSWIQFLLLGLFLLGILALLYWISPRTHPRTVASLLIWRRLEKRRPRSPAGLNPRRILSFLLAAAILLALFNAASDLRPEPRAETPEVVLLLDTGASMGARTPGGESRWEQARRLAAQLLERFSGAPRLHLLETSLFWPPLQTESRLQALRQLDGWSPILSAPQLRLEDFEFLQRPGRLLFLISDGVQWPSLAPGSHWISVFQEAANPALAAFRMAPWAQERAGREAFLEIHNYALQPQPVRLRLQGLEGEWEEEVRLAAEERLLLAVELPLWSPPFRAALLSSHDAFPWDNERRIEALPGRLSVTLVGRRKGALGRVLESEPSFRLQVLPPEQFEKVSPQGEVLVLDGVAPLAPPSLPALLWHPPSRGWLPESQVRVPAETPYRQADHPVLQFLQLGGLGPAAPRLLRPQGPWSFLAGRGEAPLLLARTRRPRQLLITTPLQDSDWAENLSFPIFVRNALEWLRQPPEYEIGSEGTVVLAERAESVRDPGGEYLPLFQLENQSLFPARTPGTYSVSLGEQEYLLEVAGFGVSSMLHRPALEAPPLGWQELPAGPNRWWPGLLLLALVLLCVECWTFHRGWTD